MTVPKTVVLPLHHRTILPFGTANIRQFRKDKKELSKNFVFNMVLRSGGDGFSYFRAV